MTEIVPGQLPSAPGTDVLGNTTPAGLVGQTMAPGVAALQAAPQDTDQPDQDEDQTRATLGDLPGVQALQNILRPVKSPAVAKMASGMDAAAKSNPAAVAAPGGWAKAVLAGVTGMMGSVSDAAAAGEPAPHGGGALTGIARTLQARGQRQAQEKEAISKEKNQELLRAETTQRIAMNTRNMYRQDMQDRKTEYDQGTSFMKNLRSRYDTSDNQDDVTQDQLNNMLSKDPNFWKTHTGRPTGEQPVYKDGKPAVDKNGNPVMSPTYSISKTDMTEKRQPISDAEAEYLSRWTGKKIPANTSLSFSELDALSSQADGVRAAQTRMEKANQEDMSAEQSRRVNDALIDPQIQHYIAIDPVGGLTEARKNADAHLATVDQMIDAVEKKNPSQPGQPNPVTLALQQKKQQMEDASRKIDLAMSALTPAAKENYEKKVEENRKQTEVERHNKADEENKRQEIVAKAAADKLKNGDFIGDENATTPEAFRASLPSASRATVDLIGQGKAPINNLSYLLSRKPEVINAVTRSYPNFEPDKIKGYMENYTKYTSGKTGDQLKSGVTALKHLQEALALNTNASHIPGTPAYNAYMNKIDTLSTELATFYGDSTVPAIANIKSTLAATLPGGREAAITTQAQSMMDKFGTLKDTWDESAPSKEYAAKMPGDLAAMNAQRNILAKMAGQTVDQTPAAPKGAANPNPGKSANGTPVWKMSDGSIQDASGKKYSQQTGQPL